MNFFLRFLLLAFTLFTSGQLIALECFDAGSKLPDGVNSETGYRMKRYRSPVPDSLPGGCIASNAEVQTAYLDSTTQANKAADNNPSNNNDVNWLFVDVYPPRGLGHDPLDGEWIISEEHSYIPGSIWLPEVGRGYLEEEHEQYFQHNLEQLTNGKLSTPIVFYCTADCWQSWNAAVRAISWGYSQVIWYPQGIDGWLEIGLDLVPAVPLNFFAHLEKSG